MFSELLEDIQAQDEKEEFFIDRTNYHISLVQKAARKIAKAYPEFNELIAQAQEHDASKFEEPERTPYIELTWNKKVEKETGRKSNPIIPQEEINQATLHHIKNNMHHPEYWLEDKSKANPSSTNRDASIECVDATNMPDLAIAEMIADWQAMSEELGTNTAREWYNEVKDVRWHYRPHQEELIDKLLRVFEREEE